MMIIIIGFGLLLILVKGYWYFWLDKVDQVSSDARRYCTTTMCDSVQWFTSCSFMTMMIVGLLYCDIYVNYIIHTHTHTWGGGGGRGWCCNIVQTFATMPVQVQHKKVFACICCNGMTKKRKNEKKRKQNENGNGMHMDTFTLFFWWWWWWLWWWWWVPLLTI